MTEPSMLLGIITLVALEIVLGIDNVVFIAILAEKLPEKDRAKARSIGLLFALFARMTLLASASWLITLKDPIIEILKHPLSIRDMILIFGGLFLIFKATVELHDRIEGDNTNNKKGKKLRSSFAGVISQIILIDTVFSIDSIITAIGMTNHLNIMITALVISSIVMIIASGKIAAYLNSHQTFIVLCLGFLLMIGCTLILEGFGFEIPKGYLYTAIAFSLSIEILNQMIRNKKSSAKNAD